MNKHRLPGLLTLIVLATLVAAPAVAQDGVTPAPGQRGTGFVFHYGSAGPRALGMGGAFIGIADDATAADTNPAGLAATGDGDVAASIRIMSYDNPAAVDFTGANESFSDTATNPRFLGVSIPVGDGAFGVFYQQTINHQISSDFSDTVTPISFIGDLFLVDEHVSIENRVQTFGGSAAYMLGEYVAVGGTVEVASLDWTQNRRLTLSDFASPSDSVTLDIDITEEESRDVTFTIGALINPTGEVSVGVAYKQGPEFSLTRNLVPTCSGLTGDLCNPINFTTDTHMITLPSTFGGGVKFQRGDIRVGADAVWVSYSDLADGFEFIMGFPADEPIEDKVEIHAGAEYGFGDPDARGFLRGGVFTSPDHDGVRFVDTDEIHFTVGGGGNFQGLELDAAVNFASSATEFLAALGYRFR